jgi:hypothetical protein
MRVPMLPFFPLLFYFNRVCGVQPVLNFYNTVHFECVTFRSFVDVTFDHFFEFDVYGGYLRQNAKHFS